MNPEDSPFTPNRPATMEYFIGRLDEIDELRAMVRKACAGQLQIGWISGERGIGKSSLAALVAQAAEQDYGALVAHVHLGGARTLEDLAKKVYISMLKENRNKSWGKKLIELLGGKIKSVDVGVGIARVAIELRASDEELATTANNFAESLQGVLQQFEPDRKVVFLVLDDINGLAENAKFAHWLKNMVDGASTGGLHACVCLLFVGLQERFWQLRQHNPSVVRVFRPLIDIAPWNHPESLDFFKQGFESRGLSLDDATAKLCAELAGGVPTVAHEIGDAVWKNAKNGKIDRKAIGKAIVAAAHSIGGRFIEPEIIQELNSESYRTTLRKIAASKLIQNEFSRKDLLALPTLNKKEKNGAGNFMVRMRKLGGFVPAGDGKRGVYKFPTRMHRIYLELTAYPQGPGGVN